MSEHMMVDMVDRVARAMAAHSGLSFEQSPIFWTGKARAAIAAMREPTEEVLRAGYNAQHPKPGSAAYGFETWATWEQACELPDFYEEKAEVYRAMIDAALS